MKKIILIALAFISISSYSQNRLPSVNIFDINGNIFNTDSIHNNGNPVIISFWATWCKPCIQELNAISDVYDEWVANTGVKLYAISIDDQRTSATVAGFVKGKSWPFVILKDTNQELKRLLGINNIPYLIVLDSNRNIVWTHTSYSMGSEEEIIDFVNSLIKQ
jgi:thiol-disulfide isomerase/thioredoxin